MSVDPGRLGAHVGRITVTQLQQLDAALRVVMAI
jgi:hypothetical protein